MSTFSVRISAEGIENIPLFGEVDEDGFSNLRSDIYGCEYSAYNVCAVEGTIGMETVFASGNIYDVLDSLARHYPEKEFHFHRYCHDGYWIDFDFGFFDGKVLYWNEFEGDIYEDLPEDCCELNE